METGYPQSELDRLYGAIQWSREKLKPFRENQKEIYKEFVGKHYSDDGADDKVPVNLLRITILVYLRLLVSNNPQVMISTQYRELRALAEDAETWMNWRIGEMKLVKALRACTQDAIVSMGIMKVGLTTSQSFEWEGQTHYYGEPFADAINLDDWVHDMRAKRWSEVAFMGHRYYMPLSAARNEPTFDPEARAKLQPCDPSINNESGDQRLTTLQQGQGSATLDDYEDYVELWELYLPRKQLIITIEASQSTGGLSGQPLRVSDWNGPACGPYHILSFVDIPLNTMPSSPASDLVDMADLVNRIFRKSGEQSDRQKTVLAVSGPADKDANNVIAANDGDVIRVDNPDKLREIRFGGVDQHQQGFLIQTKDLYSWLAGGLDTLGGLSPQAGTARQEQMLHESANNQISDMQDQEVNFVHGIMQSMAWYWWNDPIRTYEAARTIPGVDPEVAQTIARITPEQRQGTFFKLNFGISAYSLQSQTPAQKAAKIKQLLGEILLPAAPVLASQGIGINFQGLIRRIGKYEGITDLDDLLTFIAPQVDEQPHNEPPRMPATTNRINTRVNVPSGMGPGKNAAMLQTLMGSGQPNDRSNAMAVGV